MKGRKPLTDAGFGVVRGNGAYIDAEDYREKANGVVAGLDI